MSEKVTRDMKVVGKGLKGKHDTPYVVFKNSEGEKVELHFGDKTDLNRFAINQILTVTVAPVQKTLE